MHDPDFDKFPDPRRPLISTGGAWAFAAAVGVGSAVWFADRHPAEALTVLGWTACGLFALWVMSALS